MQLTSIINQTLNPRVCEPIADTSLLARYGGNSDCCWRRLHL